jgi:hypothetical protein
MLFYSESRLIFQVVISGQYRIVEFSETGVNRKVSTFQTNDKMVIDAIKKHKFYRQGKIRAEEEPEVEEPKEKPSDAMEFGSYSQLKSYLRKTFKDDPQASKIKTPKEVAEFAESKGVRYRFVE